MRIIPSAICAHLLTFGSLLGVSPSDHQPTNSPIRQISADLYEMNGIRFDKKQKTAQFETRVNLAKDLLEYGLVCKGGKLHESLLRSDVEPADLHVVMLLLGAQIPPQSTTSTNASPWIDANTLRTAPPLKGDTVTLSLQWKSDNQTRTAQIEDWVLNKQTGKPMEHKSWIYNGSEIIDHSFMAQRERSVVALVTDPFAMINNINKGHDDDSLWYANSNLVPIVGTTVLLTIHLENSDQK